MKFGKAICSILGLCIPSFDCLIGSIIAPSSCWYFVSIISKDVIYFFTTDAVKAISVIAFTNKSRSFMVV